MIVSTPSSECSVDEHHWLALQYTVAVNRNPNPNFFLYQVVSYAPNANEQRVFPTT